VRPAKKLGFHTIRLRRGLWRRMEPLDADEVPDATVESLYEVPEIIETMAT
jgi:FMN phosphatase YigB (HAD superfamily)